MGYLLQHAQDANTFLLLLIIAGLLVTAKRQVLQARRLSKVVKALVQLNLHIGPPEAKPLVEEKLIPLLDGESDDPVSVFDILFGK